MSTEDQAIAVVGAAIGHVVTLRAANFVTGEVCGREEFYFRDNNGFIAGGNGIGRGIFELIRGYEERVRWGVEDAGFVEVRGAGVFDKTLEAGVGAEDGEERIMVYEKWLGLGSGG